MSPLKRIATLAALASLLVILTLTLMPGDDPNRGFSLCVLCGDIGTTNFLLNVVLFVPLGLALRVIGWRLPGSLVSCIGLSTSIELAQLLLAGRDSTLGDILANSVGGLLGWQLCGLWPKLALPTPAFARKLVAAQAMAMTGLSVMGAWIFHPAPTAEPYYGQLASPVGETGFVRGLVIHASANGRSVESALLDGAQTIDTRTKLREGVLTLDATLELREPKMRMGTIVRIVDSRSAEIARLGLVGREAFFSVRTRATALRMRQPAVTLPGAFRCDTCPDGFFVESVAVRGVRTGPDYVLSVTARGVSRISTQQMSPNLIWVAFSQLLGTSGSSAALVTAIWLAVQYLLLAYWATRLTEAREGRHAVVASLGVACLTQVLVPIVFHAVAAGPRDWAAIVAGAALGYWVALRSSSG